MKTRFLLSMLALAFAGSILLISLLSAPQVASTTGTDLHERKLALNQEILPNHVAYPLLMAVDRLHLEAASTYERIYMQIQYGFQRFEAAEKLLDTGDQALAATTLTKSMKYFQNAAYETQSQDAPETVRTHLVKSMEYHSKEVKELLPRLREEDRPTIEKLLQENKAIMESMQ